MIRNSVFFLLILSLLAISFCGEVIEPDIENDVITLIAPTDGASLTRDTVSFHWEHLDGAREYQFRLATPSFMNATQVMADSFTTANFLSLVLQDGDYEWEVRGLNAGYSTDFFFRAFSVGGSDSAQDISMSRPDILSPADGAAILGGTVTFWWEVMPGAEEYVFRLVSPSFDNIQLVLRDSVVTSNRITMVLDSGAYAWRLNARNAAYESEIEERDFVITPVSAVVPDISGEIVVLVGPQDSTEFQTGEITLWWEEVEGATAYEVEVVSPSFAASDVLAHRSTVEVAEVEVTLDSGSYEWGVKALNAQYETQRSIRYIYINTP